MDPIEARVRFQEALQAIRDGLRDAREGVVQAVLRRNRLQDQLAKLDRTILDLEEKAALAEKIKNPAAAAELRQERELREKERESLRVQAASAEAQAEAAKTGLPEEEKRLQRRAEELRTQFAQWAGTQIDTNASSLPTSDADSMWARASDKVRNLELEASARREVAGSSVPGIVGPRPPSPEQQADAMLAEMESRLGIAPPAPNGPQAQTPPNAPVPNARFLELDAAPAADTASAVKPNLPAGETVPDSRSAVAEPAIPSAGDAATTASSLPTAPIQTPKSKIGNLAAEQNAIPKFNVNLTAKGESAHMNPTQRIRVAAIGTGNIFRGAHLPAYPDIPQVQLVALCDPDKEAQDLAYKRYQSLVEAKIKQASEKNDLATVERYERDLETVQICDDISEVIETVKPDLADICTQPFLHAPLSIQALEAGINVMCEKPISRSWLETQRLIETVRRTGKFYQHNENWLWDPDYYTAKKLIEAGAIGEPILMFLATAHGGPEGSPKFWNPEFGGGGALLDNGIHAIGASWYISGLDRKPVSVKAAEPFGMSIRMPNRIIDGRYQQVRVDDDAHILIRFEDAENGAWTTAHVEGSWSHRDSPDTAIIGTTGKISFVSENERNYAVVTDAYDKEARRIQTSGPTWQHWPSSFYGEILNMVECVRNGVQSISTAQFGADCSAIVGASYLSQKNGKRAVSPDEFKAFANEIASRYPDDAKGANDALIDALLSAVRG